jgi:hypothetical protein
MARGSTAARSARRAGEAAVAARSNPYVQRLIEDEQLRDDLRSAIDSARHAYGRVNGKGPAKALQDKKVQRDLRTAADSLRNASDRIKGKQKKHRRGRILVIALVGVGLAVVLSEGGRKAILDKLFGSEEEFEYTSTTSPTPETANA